MLYVEKPELYEAHQWLPEDLESAGRFVIWLEQQGMTFYVRNNKSILVTMSNPKANQVVDIQLFTTGRLLENGWWIVKNENLYDEVFYFVLPPDKFEKRFTLYNIKD